MDGFQWAVNDILSSNRAAASVISMSLGGPLSDAFNLAVRTASEAGVLSVAAAGNEGVDASFRSPASAPEAITVGAVDVANAKAEWSNFGAALDIFAPGVDILSAYAASDTATRIASGTSMATPHVSGLVLYLKSVYGLDAVRSAADVTSRIKALATRDVLSGIGEGSPNLLAYNGNGA